MSAVLERARAAVFSKDTLTAPNGMVLSFELVTPEKASGWLAFNKVNRNIRNNVVNAYARDMTHGNWQITPHAVAFLPDGALGNAQHTLKAIVKSGKQQWLLIARNVPDASIAAMDRGISRTITDISNFLGLEFESRRGAIAKVCEAGFPKNMTPKVTFHEVWASYEKHKDAVDFAFMLSPRKKEVGVNTTMLGVIARAWYTQDRGRLEEFVEIVRSGITPSPSDQAAIRYRDWACGHSGVSKGSLSIREIYRRTQSALKHFLDRAPITKLYGTDGDIFKIPS